MSRMEVCFSHTLYLCVCGLPTSAAFYSTCVYTYYCIYTCICIYMYMFHAIWEFTQSAECATVCNLRSQFVYAIRRSQIAKCNGWRWSALTTTQSWPAITVPAVTTYVAIARICRLHCNLHPLP